MSMCNTQQNRTCGTAYGSATRSSDNKWQIWLGWSRARTSRWSLTPPLAMCEEDTATHCTILQHTATHCSNAWRSRRRSRTATHCNTLQHSVPYQNTLQHTVAVREEVGEAWTCVNTTLLLRKWCHTVPHCNTLQHTVTHCNIHHTMFMFDKWAMGWLRSVGSLKLDVCRLLRIRCLFCRKQSLL